jgi:hypothetical protein
MIAGVCKQVNTNHFKCNEWFMFHFLGSNINLKVESGQVFYNTNILII